MVALTPLAPRASSTDEAAKGLPTGCERRGPSVRFDGPHRRKKVALTFDDGPATATRRFLRALKKLNIHATFFQIGTQVRGNRRVMRRILATGNEIANHTTHHGTLPGKADLRRTQKRIKRATGFQPCLFRPPGGTFDSRTVRAARQLGMTTVIWDVDPQDWRSQGAATLRRNVLNHVRRGSIVVMHDGGGSRGGTLAALPGIVRGLRRRGYKMVTVSKLLGYEMKYGKGRRTTAAP